MDYGQHGGRGLKYSAFISYNHRDRNWAVWLHRALERYSIPPRLRGRDTPFGPLGKRLPPVFRDRDELASGADLPDVIEESDGEMVWSADGASFLYIRLDENHRPSRVYRHHLGQDPATDELIFEETDPGWFMNVWRSRSRRFAIISIG